MVCPPAPAGESGGTGRRRRQREAGPGFAGAGAGFRSATPQGARSRSGPSGPAAAAGRRRKGSGLSAADRAPLGKAPDLEAIVARQRLGLPLSGRLREEEVTRAWKRAAADHHPDRGGNLATMQLVNTARDLLLGRGVA
jgi:hypothetical protein